MSGYHFKFTKNYDRVSYSVPEIGDVVWPTTFLVVPNPKACGLYLASRKQRKYNFTYLQLVTLVGVAR